MSQKFLDGSKSSHSLEFLSSGGSTNTKSIPGLDLVSTDKNLNPSFMSNIPSNSSLFSYNQDVTKPLHTSDDKPFNFPTPPTQPHYSNDIQQNQYSPFARNNRFPIPGAASTPIPGPGINTGRIDNSGYGQFQKNKFSQYDNSSHQPGQMDRGKSFENRYNNQNFDRNAPDSKFNIDFKYRSSGNNFRNESSDKGGNKFGNNTYAPNFQSDKFAKYLEDEYDDSRFRDPEPQNDSPQHHSSNNNRSNFSRDEFNRTNNFSNYRHDSYNKRDFNDRNNRFDRSKFDPKDSGVGSGNRQFDRNKPDNRFDKFGNKTPQFGRTGLLNENMKDNFGSRDYGARNANDPKQTPMFGKSVMPGKFDNVENKAVIMSFVFNKF